MPVDEYIQLTELKRAAAAVGCESGWLGGNVFEGLALMLRGKLQVGVGAGWGCSADRQSPLQSPGSVCRHRRPSSGSESRCRRQKLNRRVGIAAVGVAAAAVAASKIRRAPLPVLVTGEVEAECDVWPGAAAAATAASADGRDGSGVGSDRVGSRSAGSGTVGSGLRSSLARVLPPRPVTRLLRRHYHLRPGSRHPPACLTRLPRRRHPPAQTCSRAPPQPQPSA